MSESEEIVPIVVAFDSRTGNVEWFARQLGLPVKPVGEFEGECNQAVFLVTHTFGRGGVPKATQTFLNRYAGNTIGVCVSGDRRWGQLFGLAGNKIQLEYDIPLVRKIDLRGYPADIDFVSSWIKKQVGVNESESTKECTIIHEESH